ncbi:GumC family protein [Rhodohalobacter sulfatireducens]|uniref:non-specific protein-tyrosine kinase n=1 Tax=Rhodohalobacter sulfatireducens TaxID=2911366 RepID=A0ABS9KJP8_9BACT|nr:polysaccharide biosynthesis tyrosine autokinase [Rhodohalobacter sulfatireducens]MCG2591077.1 polysaccharide biosynthesis tyrosine autokinase [Rhodohalobacter sulfatireducens]
MSEGNKQSFNSNANGSPNGHKSYRGEYYYGENSPVNEGDMEELDLKQLFGTIMRYKWWVAGIVIGAALIAGVIATTIQPIYQSSGTMMISQERNRYTWAGGTDLNSMMSSSFGVGAGSRIANEIQVLQSRTLAQEIAAKIHEQEELPNGEMFPVLYLEYPDRRTKITESMLASRLMQNMTVNQVSQETDILNISYESPSPLEAKTIVDMIMETYMEVSASQQRQRAGSAMDFLEEERARIQDRLAEAEENLRDYMRNTELVQVDGQTQAAIERVAELESQRQEVQVELVAVNSSIESYESQLNEIRPGLADQFAENVSSQLENAQLRLAELRTERSLILQRNPNLRNNPESEPQLVQLNEDIETVRNEIREITSSVLNADDSDVYIGFLENEDGGVTDRIVELRRNLIELKIQESQLSAQEEVINQRLEEENQFFDNLPENMLELARLRREVDINEQLFTEISTKYQETQLWEQTQSGNGQVIDEAVLPGSPTYPNTNRFILFGFVAGLIVSVGTVLAKETFNRTVDGTDKIRSMGYPVLAVIPDFHEYVTDRFNGRETVRVDGRSVSTSWTALIDSISPISEAYRRLHNNIVFADPDKDYQTILVTSSRKAEGKSTISVNLAVAFAESGKKVLLVDADLRRPNLNRLVGEDRAPGIAELFYDKATEEDAIRSTAAPGVDIITSGQKIPNPSAVLHSKKMVEFINELKNEYDHIIIDSPPYGVITDAAPLIQHAADGILLVAQFGETQVNELNHTVENLQQIRADVLGSVLTAYRYKESRDYYYYNEYTYDSYQAYEDYKEG